MFKKLVPIVAITIVLIGCGDGGSDEATSSAASGFNVFKQAKDVTQEDLNVQSNMPLSKSQFLDDLYDEQRHIDNEDIATRSSTKNAGLDCLVDLTEQESVYNKTDEHTYVFEVAYVDVSSCYSEYDKVFYSYYTNEVSVKNKNGTYHNVFTVFSDIPNSDIESYSKREITSMYMEQNMSTMAAALNVYDTKTGLEDFSKPCTMENGHIQCKEQSITIVNYDISEDFDYNVGESLVSYKEFKTDVISKNGRYYDSGTISFKINNWSGVITFIDSNTPPTFSATDGTTELEGVLDEERTVTTKSRKIMPHDYEEIRRFIPNSLR